MSVKVRSDKQLARVATNLAIGVVGLVVIRLVTQLLPMFHDAGWIVDGKLTVLAGAVIAVDALLLSVLVRFAIEVRAYLLLRFLEISAFGNNGSLPGFSPDHHNLGKRVACALLIVDIKTEASNENNNDCGPCRRYKDQSARKPHQEKSVMHRGLLHLI